MPTILNYPTTFASPYKPTFTINGVKMPTPSTFTWTPPKVLGMNGLGRNRYYPFWECTLGWDYLSMDDYSVLFASYLGATSGATTVFLPWVYYGSPAQQAPGTWGITPTGSARLAEYFNVIVDMPILKTSVENISQATVTMTVRRIQVVPITINLDPIP